MTLTPKAALWIAVGMLTGTLAWSKYEMRSIPATSIQLETVPKTIGPWSCVKDEASKGYGIEVKTLIRNYETADGLQAMVTLQGTYTRLGGLRDWSLARTTGGWTIPTEANKELEFQGAGGSGTVRLQKLTKDQMVLYTVSWYTSPTREAASLAKAEVVAWGDRLVGRKTPWLGLYVAVIAADEASAAKAEEAAIELAAHIAPIMRQVAAESRH